MASLAPSRPVRIASRVTSPAPIYSLVYFVAVVGMISFGLLVGYRSSVPRLDMDELEYWTIAEKLFRAGEFPVGRRTPLFPVVLGLFQSVSPTLLFASIMTTLVAALSAPLLSANVYKMVGDRNAALMAGIALALWPTSLFLGTSLYSETLALPVFLYFLLLLPSATESVSDKLDIKALVGAGAVLGVAALVRPMYQLFLLVLPLILWLDRRSLRRTAVTFLLCVVGFAMIVLPWSIYASSKSGRILLLSANGGETLAGGFNDALLTRQFASISLERRSAWVGPGKWIEPSATGYLDEAELKLDYFDQDDLLKQRTTAWITENPGKTVYLAWRKLAYLWGYYPWPKSDVRRNVVGNLPLILLQLASVFALITSATVRRLGARFYILPVFVSGVAVISWGSWRFRHPADAGLLAIVAIVLAATFAKRKSLGMPSSATAAPKGVSHD